MAPSAAVIASSAAVAGRIDEEGLVSNPGSDPSSQALGLLLTPHRKQDPPLV